MLALEGRLAVNNKLYVNYNNKQEHKEIFYRKGGKFDQLDIFCSCNSPSEKVYLKVFVKEIKKEFTYRISKFNHSEKYSYDFFEFPYVEATFGIPSDLQEITLVIRTCWCKDDCYDTCSQESQLQAPLRKLDSDTVSQKCPICLKSFPLGRKALFLRCAHFFHAKCIEKLFNKNDTCPSCKKEFKAIKH